MSDHLPTWWGVPLTLSLPLAPSATLWQKGIIPFDGKLSFKGQGVCVHVHMGIFGTGLGKLRFVACWGIGLSHDGLAVLL